ncbi:MAG: HAMP domain-containing histidine kinase [Clostridiales bacterium]|nr:HAMP domain-containing histidine kinase [Clostridiales bacterium]
MIRKLRRRFALAVILSSLMILVVLISAINIVNYRRVVSDADRDLDMFTRPVEMPGPGDKNEPNGPVGMPDMPAMGMPNTNTYGAVYDSDGNVVDSFTSWNSMYANETMVKYAEDVFKGSRERGFIGDCRFIKQDQGDSTLIVLVDCGPGLSNFRNFLKASILLSLGCLALVSIGAFIVSGRAVKPVAESYEKQKRFITDAGHEIKTPLAIIKADSDVLAMDIGEDNEWLTDIRKQTTRLTDLTNNLISLSRMEEDSSVLTNELFDLTKSAKEISESFRAMAVAGNKDFTCSIEDDVEMTGDKKSVEELMTILLDNAVKYCPEGGAISFRTYRSKGNAVIEITNDTSEDISREELSHLFDRFYRTDRSRNSETGGYGIGLSMAQAIARANGGRLTVSGKAPKTIRFTASFS